MTTRIFGLSLVFTVIALVIAYLYRGWTGVALMGRSVPRGSDSVGPTLPTPHSAPPAVRPPGRPV